MLLMMKMMTMVLLVTISPGHVAVAVEGVGYEVERGERGQLVEGSRSHTTDLVPKQAQALQVVQALWKIFF